MAEPAARRGFSRSILVLIMAGGHHFMETPIGDELIAYALPQR